MCHHVKFVPVFEEGPHLSVSGEQTPLLLEKLKADRRLSQPPLQLGPEPMLSVLPIWSPGGIWTETVTEQETASLLLVEAGQQLLVSVVRAVAWAEQQVELWLQAGELGGRRFPLQTPPLCLGRVPGT